MFENDLLDDKKERQILIDQPTSSTAEQVTGDDLGIEYMERLITCLKETPEFEEIAPLEWFVNS